MKQIYVQTWSTAGEHPVCPQSLICAQRQKPSWGTQAELLFLWMHIKICICREMPSCHSYQIQRKSHSAQYKFIYWLHSKLHVKNHWCSILVSKTNKKFESGTWVFIWTCFLNSHTKPEAIAILKHYQTRNSRWNSGFIGRTVLTWPESAKCHHYLILPLVLKKEQVCPHPWWYDMVTRELIRLLSKSLLRRAPYCITTSHGWRYRPGLKGSNIFYVVSMFILPSFNMSRWENK